MEYISAEEFLKQPGEVQKVFVQWWKPSTGDLFSWIKNYEEYENDLRKLECCNSYNIVEMTKSFKGIKEGDRIPLLSEGQLRKFIEDKTEFPILKIELINGRYDIYTQYKAIDNYSDICVYDELGENLLQAYWKVAVQIAEQEVQANADRK
ncbi:hypothetical protein [Clostridium butyricum]|uniref:hypothetical protein n=1 Tax=Clostridium butyricum TaxID=1492 RepID=UPI002ABE2F97|nr:hypothetical protein [Clostridium butyricum]